MGLAMSNQLSMRRAMLAAISSTLTMMFTWVGCLTSVAERPLETETSAVRFERDVRPILKAHCFHCHGEEPELAGGLDLRLVHLMKTGGDSGTAVAPGQLDESLLYERIASGEMPPSGKRLSEPEQATIARWIAQGAQTARPEPDDPAQAKFTEEELSHWAFQPPVNAASAGFRCKHRG
jgi:uncharacterized membrane protein